MKCSNCGKDAPDLIHKFFRGTPEKPERTWVIMAPLYFTVSADFFKRIEGYCSPECSLERYATKKS